MFFSIHNSIFIYKYLNSVESVVFRQTNFSRTNEEEFFILILQYLMLLLFPILFQFLPFRSFESVFLEVNHASSSRSPIQDFR